MEIISLLLLSPRGSAPWRKQLEEDTRRKREEGKLASSETSSSNRNHGKNELETVVRMARQG